MLRRGVPMSIDLIEPSPNMMPGNGRRGHEGLQSRRPPKTQDDVLLRIEGLPCLRNKAKALKSAGQGGRMSTVYHMVHYRRFEADANVLKGKTLETLCRDALNAGNGRSPLWARPEDRVFDVGDSEGRKIFLNKVADLSSAIFGEMCLAQSRDVQALLNMKTLAVRLSELTTAIVYDLDEREAPEDSRFIRGLVYWIAVENHVFFVKTHSMTAHLLRQYLEWLLKSGGTAIGPDNPITLNAEFDQAKSAGDIGEIRSLRVAGKAAPQWPFLWRKSQPRARSRLRDASQISLRR